MGKRLRSALLVACLGIGVSVAAIAPADASATSTAVVSNSAAVSTQLKALLSRINATPATTRAALDASSTAGNQLRAVTPKGAGINCGWVTCSVYIYRGTTASMGNFLKRYTNASAAAIAGAFAVACAPLGGVSAVVCAAVGAVFGGFAIDQFVTATNQHACIRIRYLGVFPYPPTGIYVDNGGYCRN